MRHLRGKTVPIVIGGGGEFVDACAEVRLMLELDPTPRGQEAGTPMFRKADGTTFTRPTTSAPSCAKSASPSERTPRSSARTRCASAARRLWDLAQRGRNPEHLRPGPGLDVPFSVKTLLSSIPQLYPTIWVQL